MTKTIIITGTHHTPAIELIKQLQSDSISWDIHYIAHIYPSETHLINTVIPKLKVKFHNLESGKFDRRWLPNTIKGIPKTIKAVITAFSLIKTIKPDVIVSFGGYISVPVIFAGWIYRYPSLTHEQTLTPSLSTKINALFATKIALSFKDTLHLGQLPLTKTVITGNLIRFDVFNRSRPSYPTWSASINRYPLIYVTGGNQGSTAINNSLKQIIKPLCQRYTLLHQTGKLQFAQFSRYSRRLKISRYHPVEYVGLDDIGWVLQNAAVIISRSGANTAQEIAALKKSSILIPLPFSQQNEQDLNADWVQRQLPDQTVIIKQEELTPAKILDSVNKLAAIKTKNSPVKTARNYEILKLIHEII